MPFAFGSPTVQASVMDVSHLPIKCPPLAVEFRYLAPIQQRLDLIMWSPFISIRPVARPQVVDTRSTTEDRTTVVLAGVSNARKPRGNSRDQDQDGFFQYRVVHLLPRESIG